MEDGTGSERSREAVLDDLREVLSEAPVSFALVFGSTARGTATGESDLDIAVEFEDVRPGDDGYSDTYLRTHVAVAEAIPGDVDLVDVHSMSPVFASIAFAEGTVVVGSESRRDELEAELASEPSLERARERVTGAARRLRDGA